MTPEKQILANLIIRFGLSAGLAIYESIASATTDKEALAVLKRRLEKTPEDFLAEDLAKRQAG